LVIIVIVYRRCIWTTGFSILFFLVITILVIATLAGFSVLTFIVLVLALSSSFFIFVLIMITVCGAGVAAWLRCSCRAEWRQL
jgi:hypothetical protein